MKIFIINHVDNNFKLEQIFNFSFYDDDMSKGNYDPRIFINRNKYLYIQYSERHATGCIYFPDFINNQENSVYLKEVLTFILNTENGKYSKLPVIINTKNTFSTLRNLNEIMSNFQKLNNASLSNYFLHLCDEENNTFKKYITQNAPNFKIIYLILMDIHSELLDTIMLPDKHTFTKARTILKGIISMLSKLECEFQGSAYNYLKQYLPKLNSYQITQLICCSDLQGNVLAMKQLMEMSLEINKSVEFLIKNPDIKPDTRLKIHETIKKTFCFKIPSEEDKQQVKQRSLQHQQECEQNKITVSQPPIQTQPSEPQEPQMFNLYSQDVLNFELPLQPNPESLQSDINSQIYRNYDFYFDEPQLSEPQSVQPQSINPQLSVISEHLNDHLSIDFSLNKSQTQNQQSLEENFTQK